MTSGFNENEDPDTGSKSVPPYEGRREAADVDDQEKSTKEGAKTAGATGPVADDDAKAAEPSDTRGGEHAAPADEEPASESTTSDTDPDMVTKPSHTEGTPRGEDQP